MNSFSGNLKLYRKANRLRQIDLAAAVGTTQRTISYWESGMTEPDIDTLIKIAEFFDLTLDDLVGRNEI